MRHSQSYNYDGVPLENIKVEPPVDTESAFRQQSPPSTPFSPQSVHASSVTRSSSYSKRPASPVAFSPYRHSNPNLFPIDPTLGTESSSMSHPYGQRHYSATPPSAGSSRRSGSGDQHTAAFGYSDTYVQGTSRHPAAATVMTSSLSGAMGDMGVPPNLAVSMTTSPSGIAWTPQSSLPEGYNMDPSSFNHMFGSPPTPLSAESAHGSFLPYNAYNTPGFPSPSDAQQPVHPGYVNPGRYSTARHSNMQPSVVVPSQSTSSVPVPMVVSPPPDSSSSMSQSRSVEEELRRLRLQVQQLDAQKKALQRELHLARSQPSTSAAGLPSPIPTPTFAQSPQAFQESWRARMNARIKLFCSLNRAGNALCAWHDSRRERRQYPPRHAPPGYLNCGCSFEEALFEESLARHGVGSYHPGESVRMDPALRNPLLKCLQDRYGYQDGDFERDPVTGLWIEGEGPGKWEAKLAAGTTPKKNRGEERH
ncbi:unnamed protein product [Somion occarium]|uniref:Uncharacterized protein n=1 Tax=Somion occarium TaxID=3059160 RepID=A0ABP1DPH5_9APHY